MSPSTRPTNSLSDIAALKNRLRQAEHERDELRRRRRTHRALVGAGISLLLHLALILWLGVIRWTEGGGSRVDEVSFEFALVDDQSLDDSDIPQLESDDAAAEIEMTDSEPAIELDAPAADAGLEVGGAGALPAIGAGGGGAAPGGLAGGGGGASFFGVSSKGTRIAYIVDRSASMDDMAGGAQTRLDLAVAQLRDSISGLPDFARFHVAFFPYIDVPARGGWTVASLPRRSSFKRWLQSGRLFADGGTQPAAAFEEAFSLDPRPDVIFFLTDGIIPQEVPGIIRDLNGRGRRVVVNVIAVGNRDFASNPAQDVLRGIAADSGGAYRFVSTRR